MTTKHRTGGAFALLRHVIQFGAGVLIGNGYLDEASGEMLVGGMVSLANVAWFLWDGRADRRDAGA